MLLRAPVPIVMVALGPATGLDSERHLTERFPQFADDTGPRCCVALP